MRILGSAIVIALLFIPELYADVRLKDDLIIQETSIGAKFMGEIINDTDQAVKSVKLDFTFKDSSGNVLEEKFTYIAGYRVPDSSSNSLIPAGKYAPFRVWSSFMPEDISSYDMTITYTITDAEIPDMSHVSFDDDPYVTGNFLGARFRGNIANDLAAHIYNVRVLIGIRDADGVLLGYGYEHVYGEDYLSPEPDLEYYDTLVQPQSKAPFDITVSCDDYNEIASFYRIISYSEGSEGSYEYLGTDLVNLAGDISTSANAGNVQYGGAIANDTNHHLYNVTISVITHDALDNIIGIDRTEVDGTPFQTPSGSNDEAHIAPGESAPFTLETTVDYEDMDWHEYIINYQYDPEEVYVDENSPLAFTLGQNYPNPFNPTTTIAFTLPERSEVRLDVFNVSGQKVAQLIDSDLDAGHHAVTWNASHLSSGMYFYTLTANGQQDQRRMTLIK